MKLSIVITAYNRAEALQNLLNSLYMVRPVEALSDIPLVISIDNGGTPEVNRIAEEFKWALGEKSVVIHPEKLGLVRHFIWAGDQTEKYENVIFLEDDLIVSPELLNYSTQIIDFYKNMDEIAGASLYNPILNENTGTKFYQLHDDADVYFLQHPYWGNIWMREKWNDFKQYMKTYKKKPELLPSNVALWGTKSFKQKYIQYLIETCKTMVTARISIVTNNGFAGLHSREGLYMYQNTLKLTSSQYRLIEVKDSLAVYDAYEEIDPVIIKKLNPKLAEYDFCVDLNGTKQRYNSKYVLTTKKSKSPIMSFSSLMKPIELGVIMNQVGDENVCLSLTDCIVPDKLSFSERLYADITKNYKVHYGKTLFFHVSKNIIKKHL